MSRPTILIRVISFPLGVLGFGVWFGCTSVSEEEFERYIASGKEAQEQARYAEAEELYLAALQEAENFDRQGRRLATGLVILGELYMDQDRYAEAEPLFRRALAIDEKAVGEHPNTATALHSLGKVYYKQGKYAEAEPLYQRSLSILEKVSGPVADIAGNLNNLALLFVKQGRYEEAEQQYERALDLYEKALGPQHPNVAVSLENYAFLLREMRRDTEADGLEERARAIWAKEQ